MKIHLDKKTYSMYSKYFAVVEKYKQLANAIDTLSMAKNKDSKSLNDKLKECQKYIDSTKNPLELTVLYYFQYNALIHCSERKTWKWSIEEEGKELHVIRKSIKYAQQASDSIPPFAITRKYTNYGNALVRAGLFIEALEAFDTALFYSNTKGTAMLANAEALSYYYYNLYQESWRKDFMIEYIFWIKNALSAENIKDLESEGHNIASIRNKYKAILEKGDLLRLCDEVEKLAYAGLELKYREWCLNNNLFLNPLNDICHIANNNFPLTDNIHLPTFAIDSEKRNLLPNKINRIKQEFVSARFLFYDSMTNKEIHYSDKDNQIDQHPEFSDEVFSLRIEKIKMAFKTIFSIFDKLALILLDFYNIDIPAKEERRRNFRNFWYEESDIRNSLRKEFSLEDNESDNISRENLPLRGLFVISNDFSSRKNFWKDSIDDEMEEISKIRNYLEHKGLGISLFTNDLDKSGFIAFQTLTEKTLYLFKKCRNAIIYTMLSIYVESLKENKKEDDFLLQIKGLRYDKKTLKRINEYINDSVL